MTGSLILCALVLVQFSAPPSSTPPSGVTTLGNPELRFTIESRPYAVLRHGEIEAILVDNQPVDDDVLPGHRAGYSGLASLTHARRRVNLFVPSYAGLNFEHIHDGTTQPREVLFEPRHAPMELRRISPRIVELYQKPTPHFGLESCLRYELLPDGAIEMTFECIPRRAAFKNGYIGLFWASYINQPESKDIYFLGQDKSLDSKARLIRASTPRHGVEATHLASGDRRTFPHDADFPLSLVFNQSRYRYSLPWFYGISHGMAYAQVFRSRDSIRFAQSPSGGGEGNPAWDFQLFIPDYRVGQLYRSVMQVLFLPFESAEQVEKAVAPHVRELEGRRN